MNLVIVESPTKAKTLSKFLGKEYTIESSVGHVRDLPKSKLGVDLDNDFEPVYENVKGKSKVISKLRKLSKQAKSVYLAMDPDREGEAIAWHVSSLLTAVKKSKTKSKKSDKFMRVSFHEITKGAIEAALEKPGEIDGALVDAQQARRVLDRLVGYKLSPVLWKKVRRGLSAGRVQSVALRMIVEREIEIEAYKPSEYWEVRVKVRGQTGEEGDFWVELVEVGGKKVVVVDPKKKSLTKKQLAESVQLSKKSQIEKIIKELKKANYWVTGVERKERKRRAYPPFTTSTLQQAAANVLGWSGKQTMRIAQQLYEAGLITYHRTDSTNLSSQAVMTARELVQKEYGKAYVPDKPIFYKTRSKSAQEAHEAIRPTDVGVGHGAKSWGENGMTKRHERLYRLIWQRMMACQMTPAVYDQTSVEVGALLAKNGERKTKNNSYDYGLRASGSILKFDGWTKIYNEKRKTNNLGGDVILPEVGEGEELEYRDIASEQKFTQPPPRYNDASLVKELEKRGIGRPSTYASIIGVLDDRGYVERQEKRFYPTVVGKTVVEFLTQHFDHVMDYDFTAEMEEDLDRIARGEKEWRGVLKNFWGPFEKKLEKVVEKAERVAIPVEKTGKPCPDCKKGELVVRTGRYGKFLSCDKFPECKHTAPLKEVLEGVKCPECGAAVVVKKTRRGRTFYGCDAYPKCDWASWNDPRGKK